MSSTAALVSLEEYLNTSYRPDVDFVDGVLVERNVGTQRHGSLQAILIMYSGSSGNHTQFAYLAIPVFESTPAPAVTESPT